jgi:hypothetical protein
MSNGLLKTLVRNLCICLLKSDSLEHFLQKKVNLQFLISLDEDSYFFLLFNLILLEYSALPPQFFSRLIKVKFSYKWDFPNKRIGKVVAKPMMIKEMMRPRLSTIMLLFLHTITDETEEDHDDKGDDEAN